MKITWKKLVPIFLALVFLGSVLAVFTTGGTKETNEAEIVVDFGTPNQYYRSELKLVENSTALRLLSSYATRVQVDSGNVKCIADYCNTKNSQWNFYVLENGAEVLSEESVENYIVKDGELIIFRYEWSEETDSTA